MSRLISESYTLKMVSKISDVDGHDHDNTTCDYCANKAIYDCYWILKSEQNECCCPLTGACYCCDTHYKLLKGKSE